VTGCRAVSRRLGPRRRRALAGASRHRHPGGGSGRFWIHRVLESEGIKSHVVDAASILTSRRRRRAKTDKIDGETLLRTLMAYLRGEPRCCSMVKAPTPEEEDRRRICRERKTLVSERVSTPTASKACSSPKGSSATSRCAVIAARGSKSSRPATARPLPSA